MWNRDAIPDSVGSTLAVLGNNAHKIHVTRLFAARQGADVRMLAPCLMIGADPSLME